MSPTAPNAPGSTKISVAQVTEHQQKHNNEDHAGEIPNPGGWRFPSRPRGQMVEGSIAPYYAKPREM
jgi:hypothetical protein